MSSDLAIKMFVCTVIKIQLLIAAISSHILDELQERLMVMKVTKSIFFCLKKFHEITITQQIEWEFR